ncbi:transposable element Tcb2 transposase [Trichonephila clavipes]|nr:transposable element Tcb2 transposase [Trichonephila clavipes]
MIGIQLSAMMAAFVLDAMSVNAAFQNVLSNDIVAYHPELWFGVRFRIMYDPICYELRSADLSPIEHVWDLVGLRLARDPHPTVSKDELLLRIQAIWNSLLQADIRNLFDSMPRRTATLIATHGGYTKY